MKLFSLVLVVLFGFCMNVNAQTPTSVAENQDEEEIIYPYYTIVVGSFGDPVNAKKFADSVTIKGFEPYFRKNENGTFYRICVYRLKTEEEAETRLKKLKNIDYIFFKAWVLGYNRISDNINYEQL